jgi:hypothetical protein
MGDAASGVNGNRKSKRALSPLPAGEGNAQAYKMNRLRSAFFARSPTRART